MKVYVYGTGCGAGELIDTALPIEKVTAFVESQPTAESFLGKPVISPESLSESEYDLVLVATSQAEAVAARCEELGIDRCKLFFLKNSFCLTDRNRDCAAAQELLGEAYIKRLRDSQRLIRAPLWSKAECLPASELENDYVRLKTLEAVCLELGELPGAAAELGVYRGGFARHINALLPKRRLYLFDTFEGFETGEAAGYGKGFVSAHKKTSEQLVLSALPNPEQACIRKGLFPRSAVGLEEERFALVSLDADLEESTFAGLCWFLPRMTPGGFLLLHDYNNPKLPGVKAAVARYERQTGNRLLGVPICDVNGTLIICA